MSEKQEFFIGDLVVTLDHNVLGYGLYLIRDVRHERKTIYLDVKLISNIEGELSLDISSFKWSQNFFRLATSLEIALYG